MRGRGTGGHHRGDALVTVPVGDANALAAAIRALHGPARIEAAKRARAAFVERFSDTALARDLDRVLGELVNA